VLRALEMAHWRHGRLGWAALFEPAIELSQNGFALSPRLHALLAKETHLKNDATAFAYFYQPDGTPKPVGTILKNPALATTLREIADKGADAFYQGEIARDIVAKVRSHPTNPGRLSEADLVGYRAKERQAVCVIYRSHDVCGMPAPAGGIVVAQILGLLEHTDIARHKPKRGRERWRMTSEAVHFYTEAARLAFADRGAYLADPDFVEVPPFLLDKDYLKQRAKLIGEMSMGKAAPGAPPGQRTGFAGDESPELAATSHVSIVDARGHALSMTTSIEDVFGSRQMVRGFLLNNQLTDFSFTPREADKPVANRVEPGKRPRSSMSPTLVLKDKRAVMAIGSPGGANIINYVGKVLIATLDWDFDIQEAISLPNFGSRNGPTELEKDRTESFVMDDLARTRRHDARLVDMTSGLHGIRRMSDGWRGGADPRREGTARGD